MDQTAERPVPANEKSGLHFCFDAPTRKSVDAFHAAGLRAGGRDNGKPGLFGTTADYYAAFVAIRTAIGSRPMRREELGRAMSGQANALLDALHAGGPSADRHATGLRLAIGSWGLDVTGSCRRTERRRPGEWHLAGR